MGRKNPGYTEIRVSLVKPMGIVFSERGRNTGLFISDLPRTGEAARCGELQRGDILTHVGSTKMDRLSFDSAMAILASTGGDFVHMTFKRKITSSGNGDSSVASGHHAARGRGRRRGKRKEHTSKSITRDMLSRLDAMCGNDRPGKGSRPLCGSWLNSRDSMDSLDSFDSRGSDASNYSEYTEYTEGDFTRDDETYQSEVSNRNERALAPLARMRRNRASYGGSKPDNDTLKAVAAAAAASVPTPPQFDDFGATNGDIDRGAVSLDSNSKVPSMLDVQGRPVPGDDLKAKFESSLNLTGSNLTGQDGMHVLNSGGAQQAAAPKVHPTQAKIAELLQKNEPERLAVLGKLMKKFKNKEDELLDRLEKRYAKKSKAKKKKDQEEKKVDSPAPPPPTEARMQEPVASQPPGAPNQPPPPAEAHMQEPVASQPPGAPNEQPTAAGLSSASNQNWNIPPNFPQPPPQQSQTSPFRAPVNAPTSARQSSRTSTDQTEPGSDRAHANVAAAPGRGAARGVTGDRNTSESTAHTEPTTDSCNYRGLVEVQPQVSVLKPILKTQPQRGALDFESKGFKSDSEASRFKSDSEALNRSRSSRRQKAVGGRSMSQDARSVKSSDRASSKKKKKKHKRSLTKEIQEMGNKTSATVTKAPDDPFYAKINRLVNYVYGETSEMEHEARIATILKAYKGRELILMKLLETKAEVKDDVESRGSFKAKSSNKSLRSSKSGKKRDIPRHISYESSGVDSSDEDTKSSRRRSRSGPPRARKGVTKSSNGDEDTISDISYGTAKFARRQAMRDAEREDAASGIGSSKSSKENNSMISSVYSSSKRGLGKEKDKHKEKRNIFGFKKSSGEKGGGSRGGASRTDSRGEVTIESGFNEI